MDNFYFLENSERFYSIESLFIYVKFQFNTLTFIHF